MYPVYFAIKIIMFQFVLGWVIFDRTLIGLRWPVTEAT